LHPYSITHRLAEDYLLEANQRGKLSGVVFRLTNAVGSPVNREANCWMLVVNDLCRQVVVEKKMVLRSDEAVERDYIPISSVTDAVFSALEGGELDGELSGIYNLSSGETLSLKALTDLIAERTEELLGFTPETHFSREEIDSSNDTVALKISNIKLKESGFIVENDLSDEIDRLLLNSYQWFA